MITETHWFFYIDKLATEYTVLAKVGTIFTVGRYLNQGTIDAFFHKQDVGSVLFKALPMAPSQQMLMQIWKTLLLNHKSHSDMG